MSSDNYFMEKLASERIRAGLADPQVDEEIGKVKIQGEEITPSDGTEQDVPLEPLGMSPYAREELDAQEDEEGVVASVAKGVVNGTIKAGESMSTLMASGLNMFVPKDSNFRFKAPKPALFEVNKVGKVTEGITQFGLQYYTGGNILRGAKMLQAGGGFTTLARGMVQGTYADFTAFKGDEERLSNFLTQFDSPILNNEVTRYLAADEDDSDLEGRLKNVMEGGIVGVGIEMIVPMIRGIKNAKKALLNGDQKGAEAIMQAAKEQTAEAIDRNADTLKAEYDPTKEIPVPKPEVNKAEVQGEWTAKIWTKPEAEAAINTVKALKQEDPDAFIRSATKIIGENIHLDKLDTGDDVMAVMGALSEIKVPTFDTWSHGTQLEMARSRGMDVPTLRKYFEIGAVNEQVLLSSEILLKRQSELVTDLINKNVNNNYIVAEVAKYQELLNMTASFKNISGRTLDSNRIKLKLKKKDIEQAQRFMTERFGDEANFDKFKEAWTAADGDMGTLAGINKVPVHKIMADSALELWKNGLLSGIKTVGVNFFGNYVNLYKEIGVRFFSGLSGAGRQALKGIPQGQERVYMGEALSMAQAQVDGFMEMLTTTTKAVKNKNFLKDFTLPRSINDKAELGYMRKISADYWGIGTTPGALARYVEKMTGIPGMKTQSALRRTVDLTGSVVNVPGNLLNITDGITQNSARRTQRYALAYRRMMEEGVPSTQAFSRLKQIVQDQEFQDSVQESVEDFATRVTFQDSLGPNGMKLQQLVKGVRPLHIPVLEFIIPFVRTPINIFKQGVTEVNPIFTSLQAATGTGDFTKGMKAGGIETDEVMGRAAFGSTASLAAVTMATNGMITGAGPSDPEMRKVLMRTGWRPYSVKIEDGYNADGSTRYKYIQYGRLEPIAWLVGSMATIIEQLHYTSTINQRKERDWKDYSSAFIVAMNEATLDKSFFSGVSDFFGMMNNPQQNLGAWQNRFAGSLVPNISRDIEIMLQDKPYMRDVRSAEDAIANKTIGGSQDLPVARNRWGDPIAMDEGWVLGGRSYFSPIGMSEGYAEPIDLEISRLAIHGVDTPDGPQVFTNAMIAMPDRTIVRKGVSIRLDSGQYSRLLEIAGKEIKRDALGLGQEMTMKEALNYLVTKSEAYKLAKDLPAAQARMIKDTSKKYDSLARDQLFEEYPDLKQKLDDAERYDSMSKAGVGRPEDQYKVLEDLDAR